MEVAAIQPQLKIRSAIQPQLKLRSPTCQWGSLRRRKRTKESRETMVLSSVASLQACQVALASTARPRVRRTASDCGSPRVQEAALADLQTGDPAQVHRNSTKRSAPSSPTLISSRLRCVPSLACLASRLWRQGFDLQSLKVLSAKKVKRLPDLYSHSHRV